MIDLLVGSDIHAIQKKVAFFKTTLNKTWAICNYHKFDSIDIEKAICCALTPAFGITGLKLVIVENCDFKQIAPETFSALQSITKLTDTHLVLWGTSIDKRLKAVKLLLKCANLFECDLMPPWRTDLITSKISSEAIHLKLELNQEIVQYLAVAVGNNLTRAESELKKLLTYSAGKRVNLAEVKRLIPSSTQSSLQLAEAIRTGKAKEAASLLGELLAMNNHPMMICATLLTQFRTWLWIKSVIQSGVNQDTEIAKTCNIGNSKRVYFLKQEVQHTSLAALKYAVKMLFDLEISLKTGYQSSHLLLSIISVSGLFSS